MPRERLPQPNPESPERREPSMRAIELAGSLQSILRDLPNRDYELDIHQEAAIDAIGKGIMNGEIQGYLDAATGSGKSLLIALLAEAAVNAGQRVLILAPTMTIADQLIGADQETGIGRFTDLVDNGLVKQNYGGKRGNKRHPVVVGTYSGILHESRAHDEGRDRLGEFDLILGDECHESLGAETSAVMRSYMPEAIKVGFSATPDYAEDRRSDEIYGKPWFEFSLRTAIESGVAAPLRPLLFSTDSTLELSEYRADYTDKELAPLINNMERNGLALRLARDFVTDGRQGIIACVPGDNNAHAILMAHLLSNMQTDVHDIVAADIGSHLSVQERQQRLQAFRDGDIDILTFTRALEFGWDSARASFCINTAPATSPVRIKQLLGRIGRPKPDGREGIFVDFLDDKKGIDKPQYTALHALDLYDVDVNRVLGWEDRDSSQRPSASKRVLKIHPELHERLMRLQGRLLSEATARKVSLIDDPLAALWERKLAKEGLPAELPSNIVFTPRLNTQYEKAVAVLERQLGDAPSSDEVADYLSGKITKEQERVIRGFGQRALESLEPSFILPDPHTVVARIALKDTLNSVLDTLSEREAGVVSMRHGVNQDDPEGLGLDEVGRVYGVTRERVRQIESKAMSKMRHQSRSAVLREFLYDEGSKPVEQSSYPVSVFGATQVVLDAESRDGRPYARRAIQEAQVTTESWLQRGLETLSFMSEEVSHATYARKLRDERLETTQQLKKMTAMRSRIEGRPLQPESVEQRRLSLDVLDIKIEAHQKYATAIYERLLALGHDEDDQMQ